MDASKEFRQGAREPNKNSQRTKKREALETWRVAWTTREDAPLAGAALATGGNLLFAGTMDRWFRAYDTATGRERWHVRLDNVPSSFPVTYAVERRQYLAVVTNEGTIHANNLIRTARLNQPVAGGATLWVFSLSERTR